MAYCFTRNILNNFAGLEDNSLLTALNVDDEDTDEMNVIRHSPYYSLENFIDHNYKCVRHGMYCFIIKHSECYY